MSSTDKAGAFYADYLLPLKHANQRRDLHYFTRGPDAAASSYWEKPFARGNGLRRLGPGEQDGAALLRQLGDYWVEQKQAPLKRMLLALEEVRQATVEPANEADAQQSKLTDFIYPLH
jgi:hypothetical protein